MGRRKFAESDVLCYRPTAKNRDTVRRYYKAWRRKRDLPDRCDNPACGFHAAPLRWNGQKLPLILDHSDGNCCNDSPQNLRYLCPNCDSQNTETRGGGNRNRIQSADAVGYEVAHRDGRRDAKVFPETLIVE